MITNKSPTITVFRLRSDQKMLGCYIPIVLHRQLNGEKSLVKHATTIVWSCVPSEPRQITEATIPYANKSDYIYLTQSIGSSCDSREMLISIRFPLDDLDATRALFSHITELMRNTNTVTLKCDFNAYLNNVSISRNLALHACTTLNQGPVQVVNERQTIDETSSRRQSSYTKFDDLLVMVANERTLMKRAFFESPGWSLPRLRLCGGGEDSINNGTSAWGTPPGATNGTSAWGLANQQPPQAWAAAAANGGNTVNNNNQAATSQPQRQPSQPQDQNANKAPQQIPNVNNSSSNGGTPNAWNRNPSQPSGPNPNIANNNQQQAQSQQQQQPPQQQLVMGNNGTVATKSQLEMLSNMREALFSQDGWGYQHVNQDTNWEVPGSPEPGKMDTPNNNNATGGAAGGGQGQGQGGAGGGGAPNPAASGWKPCNQNNGTELWEANLRNGGAPPPPQPVQKAPWGPSTNIGGTWGEDDDSVEASVWNGSAAGANQPAAAPPAWGQNNPAMWPPGTAAGPNPVAVKKESDWSGVIGNSTGAAVNVPPAVAGWENRGGTAPAVNLSGPIGQSVPVEATREIRGDPRGISGRLNGNVGMWDQPNVQNLSAATKIVQGTLPAAVAGVNSQWNAQVPNKLPSSWDDPSSPMNTRPTLEENSGTIWNQGTLSRQNSNVSNWKDIPDNIIRNPIPRAPLAGGANLPLGPATRGVGLRGINSGIKTDNSLWGQNQGLPLNSSWDECSASGGWDDKSMSNNAPWNDFGQNTMWNKGKQTGGWPDPNDLIAGGSGADWTMNKPPNKMSPAEFIRSSKHYRMLCENGFKKEDVEYALRNTNMNFEESLDILQRHSAVGGLGDWRRPDEHPGTAFEAQFSSRFPAGPGTGMPFSQNQNLLNSLPGVGGANPNHAALKYLSQGPATAHSSFTQGPNPLAAAAVAGNQQNPQAQPSTQQLRMLVQQIQMAVHAGFLNHQILNQPLAPQTLLLLNQLLNHIRQMQHIQSNLARSGGATGVSTVQLTMQINKHKQQISQLQQQIAAQQAIYVKQQQQQQQQQQPHQPGGPHQPPGTPGSMNPGLGTADFLRQQELVSLQNNFADMGLNKDPVTPGVGFPPNATVNSNNPVNAGMTANTAGVTSQQSRLNQWKLPSIDKDGGVGGANDLTDFSRAPGTTAKPTLSTVSSNISSLGLQDGTWSSGRSNLADGWPDPSSAGVEPENKDWGTLVPEFEPGKPWKVKGAQMKIDEDPSITPGSVARSPLSISAVKEADLFGTGGKSSPTDTMGLTSSTWSFNPSQPGATGKMVTNAGKNVWPESISSTAASTGSDLWGTTMGKTTRGPPPGLGASKNTAAAANGWTGGGSGTQRPGAGGNWSGGNNWGSSWLLLKNLTSQIDGATLRTLCMQHGPLQNLQLYLNHGLALCKYSSRDEANKAQQALNNCPLGSTTIGAECPSEAEVQTYLQQLGAPTGNIPIGIGNTGGGINSSGSVVPPSSSGSVTSVAQSWRQTPRGSGADTWGSGWPPSNTGGAGNLWAPLEGGAERGTPSNLNSFLPESLLGPELN
ncbi:protein Gawky-like isoform X1 [Wyeomyia smithii]|uniref:protein Gawky-like isoform X1 n=1 Tax=Wyeomyia smithii TaxID=174621 RepID=UPI002467E8AA|nr:protein Gawky-like isoform X1 [Wyeomyia smithii]